MKIFHGRKKAAINRSPEKLSPDSLHDREQRSGFPLDVCTTCIARGWIFQIFIIPPPHKTFYILSGMLCESERRGGWTHKLLAEDFFPPPLAFFHRLLLLGNLSAIGEIETLFYVNLIYCVLMLLNFFFPMIDMMICLTSL